MFCAWDQWGLWCILIYFSWIFCWTSLSHHLLSWKSLPHQHDDLWCVWTGWTSCWRIMQHCSVDCSSHSGWLRPVIISVQCWYCCTISNDLLILLTVVSTFKLLSVSRQSSQIMRTVNSVSTYSAAYFLLLYRSTCDIFTAGNYLPSVAISLCSAELHAVGISVMAILHAPVAASLPQVLKYKLANKSWLLSINIYIERYVGRGEHCGLL